MSVDSGKGGEESQQDHKGLGRMSLHCLMAPKSKETLTQVQEMAGQLFGKTYDFLIAPNEASVITTTIFRIQPEIQFRFHYHAITIEEGPFTSFMAIKPGLPGSTASVFSPTSFVKRCKQKCLWYRSA